MSARDPLRLDFLPWEFAAASDEERRRQAERQRRLDGSLSLAADVYVAESAAVFCDELRMGERSYIAAHAYVTGNVSLGADSHHQPVLGGPRPHRDRRRGAHRRPHVVARVQPRNRARAADLPPAADRTRNRDRRRRAGSARTSRCSTGSRSARTRSSAPAPWSPRTSPPTASPSAIRPASSAIAASRGPVELADRLAALLRDGSRAGATTC